MTVVTSDDADERAVFTIHTDAGSAGWILGKAAAGDPGHGSAPLARYVFQMCRVSDLWVAASLDQLCAVPLLLDVCGDGVSTH